jgi:hypothetical protein
VTASSSYTVFIGKWCQSSEGRNRDVQRVLKAGIDTLYLNAYYADPQTLRTAVDDLLEDIEKLLEDKGVSFQDLLQVKQHRYSLRKASTREADQRGNHTFLPDDEEEL